MLYLVIAGLPEYEVLKLLRDFDDFFWTIAFFRHSYHASQFHEESLKWNHDDTTQNTVLVNYASDKVVLLNALKMQFRKNPHIPNHIFKTSHTNFPLGTYDFLSNFKTPVRVLLKIPIGIYIPIGKSFIPVGNSKYSMYIYTKVVINSWSNGLSCDMFAFYNACNNATLALA